MTSQLSPENWLFDPQVLKLVRECRRLVRSEFGVTLHLTETHLAEQLADFSGQSRSMHLPRTWSVILKKVPELLTASRKTPTKRMYRGQEVMIDTPPTPQAGTGSETQSPRRTRVIYRGQEVL